MIFSSKDSSLKIGGELNPYIKGNALDSHYLREKQFYDSFDGAFGFSAKAEFNYKKIFIKTDCRYVPLLKGITSDNVIGIGDSGFSQTDGFTGGSSYTSFSIAVGYKA